jgi:hypothetical protein
MYSSSVRRTSQNVPTGEATDIFGLESCFLRLWGRPLMFRGPDEMHKAGI